MTLRLKALTVLLFAGIMAFVCIWGMSCSVIMKNNKKLEQNYVSLNTQQVISAINNELDALATIANEWGSFDDTYQYMQDNNVAFLDANVSNAFYSSMNIYCLLFINRSGEIITGEAYDKKTKLAIPVPDRLLPHLAKNGLILSSSTESRHTTGILSLPEGTLLIAAYPILTTEGAGPVNGTVIMGRMLDSDLLDKINRVTHLSFKTFPYDGSFTNSLKNTVTIDRYRQNVYLQTINDDRIESYTVLRDIYGQKAVVLQVNMERDIHNEAEMTISYFALAIAALMLVLVFLVLWVLNKFILRRITYLGYMVSKIGSEGDLSTRIVLDGNDEISHLTEKTNKMLSDLELSHMQLAESREQYKRLFDEALSANYIASADGQIILCNSVYAGMFGYSSVDDAVKSDRLFLNQESRESLIRLVEEKRRVQNNERELIDCSGRKITVLENVVGIFDAQDKLMQIQGYMIDISKRKQAEKEIGYLSYHDRLTGLHNRLFFEQEVLCIDTEDNLPLSVVVIDVNGLKLVNDALGHSRGDELLVKVAHAIKTSCREQDVSCRWGGDEFLVLLPHTESNEAELIREQIKEACEGIYIQGIQTSASLGLAVKRHSSEDFQKILCLAEERMYRNKLLQHTSNRNALVKSLEKTLRGKSHETEEHARRLREMVVKMGITMKLPDNELDELALLAALHDIGKIAVPDEILNKPGKLSPDEWEVMKKHSEIGYRIAKSSPEMASVAEAVLYHHERWDGLGYPLRLKAKEIPIHSRIIAIADAYDVMTNGRVYRKGITSDKAVDELRRCAGTQFDPMLVEIFITGLE